MTARSNALAESTIGLYKAELVRRQGPWRGIDDLELATLEYIDWFLWSPDTGVFDVADGP